MANIMTLTDSLFLRCCQEVAAVLREIEYGVDNACMQLVMRPEQRRPAGRYRSTSPPVAPRS
jgi:isocitrate/isopropylmalate dehydrogenase